VDSAAETLLIIVSATLSVFLVVAIITMILFIRLIKKLRIIAERADNVAQSVESAAESFEKRASSMAVLSMIANIVDKASKVKRGKG
jgi:hypothetical protein